MKAFSCLFAVFAAVILLTGCKNRFESYEPYSTFDERMAAAEAGRPYVSEDPYAGQFARAGDGFTDRGQMRTPPERGMASSGSAEVPFSSSRGSKHVMNIGAMEE